MRIEFRYLDLDGIEQQQVVEGPEVEARWAEFEQFMLGAIAQGCFLTRKGAGVRDYIPAHRLLGIRVTGLPAAIA